MRVLRSDSGGKGLVAAVTVGAAIAFLGALLVLLEPVLHLEEDVGLRGLYRLRDAREPPPGLVIVNIDAVTGSLLGLPAMPSAWPRGVHSCLLRRLQEAGASVVVFDMFFSTERLPPRLAQADTGSERAAALRARCAGFLDAPDMDAQFAQAAGEGLTVVSREVPKARQGALGEIVATDSRTRLGLSLPPYPALRRQVVASGPLLLPQAGQRVNWYLAFNRQSREVPSLPVAALAAVSSDCAAERAPDRPGRRHQGERLNTRAAAWRERFVRGDSPGAAELSGPDDACQARYANAIREVFTGPDRRHLNFYGPAAHIRHLPYQDVLTGPVDYLQWPDLVGHIVFVGFSETFSASRNDHFRVAYPRRDGVDLMAGVEILATAVGNMLDASTLRPLSVAWQLLVVACFGVFGGFLFLFLRPGQVLVLAGTLGIAWFAGARYLFANEYIWLPWAVPLLCQLPVAIVLNGAVTYTRLSRLFTRLVSPAAINEQPPREVEGICMATDAENFTSAIEQLDVAAQARLMNDYYGPINDAIEAHGGNVIDWVGDGSMSEWHDDDNHQHLCEQVLTAGLGVLDAVDRFNQRHPESPLPTRVGACGGQFSLGLYGERGKLVWKAVGDVVNTASRLESLNKWLGTRMLVSEDVLVGLPDFAGRVLFRYCGMFRLKGRDAATGVYEIAGWQRGAAEEQRALFAAFEQAMASFTARDWVAARDAFDRLSERFPDDGPTRFFLKQAARRADDTAGAAHSHVIAMQAK